jgi:hypothetical protein
MLFHVLLRKLNPDGEDADGKNDSGHLERDFVCDFFISMAPAPWIEDIGAVWTNYDAEDEGPDGLADVQLPICEYECWRWRRMERTRSLMNNENMPN